MAAVSGPRGQGWQRSILSWIAVAATVAGIVALVVFVRAQQSAPVPPASQAGHIRPPHSMIGSTRGSTRGTHRSSDSITHVSSPAVGGARQHPLPVSRPRWIEIPAIHVDTAVISVGKNSDGTVQVPQPGPNLNKAAWYDGSATPGRIGPTVIVGHVDTTEGPSVFFDLGDVRRGDKILVRRADGITVVFTVDGIRDYPEKSDFPTRLVYGGDLTRPNLRVVTCSNFDSEIGHYVGNIVVFAHMTAVHKQAA